MFSTASFVSGPQSHSNKVNSQPEKPLFEIGVKHYRSTAMNTPYSGFHFHFTSDMTQGMRGLRIIIGSRLSYISWTQKYAGQDSVSWHILTPRDTNTALRENARVSVCARKY